MKVKKNNVKVLFQYTLPTERDIYATNVTVKKNKVKVKVLFSYKLPTESEC